MAKQIRVKVHSPGARQVLRAEGVAADLGGRAGRIASAAGPGFEVDVTTNRDRAVAFVRAATPEARAAEAEGRKLTRAVDAGRG